MAKQVIKPQVVKKAVKHLFSPEELAQLNKDFGQAYDNVTAAEADFDAVKSVHKAKIQEAQSRMVTLRATINAGFDIRAEEVQVIYRPKDRKKDFYPAGEDLAFYPDELTCPLVKPILTEDMTPDDFQQDLIAAESHFSNRKHLMLWEVGSDRGILIVGQFNGKWYSALRCNVGDKVIEERLDSLQKAFKMREMAIVTAADRAIDWLTKSVGKDGAKGFAEPITKTVEAESGKVE